MPKNKIAIFTITAIFLLALLIILVYKEEKHGLEQDKIISANNTGIPIDMIFRNASEVNKLLEENNITNVRIRTMEDLNLLLKEYKAKVDLENATENISFITSS